ncbi:ABC transporter permease subunit [Pseudomonas sp. FSL R10-0056]|uniref:Fe(3+)-transport system permease protein FbpB n=3 Tax=Pseudomonas TaxID=286 RepID=A0A267BN87_PSEFR|nr:MULTISPECIES: iron ABC transporter permease [Pseudomonas]MBP3861682.1 iron ABC transporter permease [Pseudomonas sp.]MCH4885069.1 iron ABC transporter permease [Pseudomonas sp. TMW22080]MDA7023481.1 iron ABC transporter permease [Pseudomonas fragi]MDN5392110.1 iron ABC transporter permease [Pseudomonas sp.]MDN5405508.1 iron ABC transporter permease [Pseudomonas sp.]
MLSAAQPARFTPTRKKPSIWLLLPVLLLVGLSLLPLLYVGTKAWQAGWSEALHLLWRPYVFGLMRNTLLLMIGVTLTCALVGLSLAWLLERSNLAGRRLWGVILCLPFAVPAFVSSFTWVSLSASFEGLGGAILVMSLSKYPLIFLPVAATLRNLDPALEESARTLGQNRWGVFFKITLPLLWPSLLAGSLLIALHMLVEFGALSIIGLQTFTTAIYQQFELEFSNANAAMLSAVLLVMCLSLLWLELKVRGKGRHIRIGQGAARHAEQVNLGKWSLPGQLYCLALAVIGSGIPLGMLAYWLIKGSSAAFPLAEIGEALFSSLSLALGGAALCLVLAVPVGLLVVRYKGPLAIWAERLPYLLHALPGLVIALALVYFALHYVPALYQTSALLLIAYALLFLPLAQAPIRTALNKAAPQLEEAARTLGATSFTAFCRVTLPIIFPALGAAFALVFLDAMKELTATLLLSPTGLNTLATQVWSHTSNIEFAAAAPYAALLILVSGLPVYLLTTRMYLSR